MRQPGSLTSLPKGPAMKPGGDPYPVLSERSLAPVRRRPLTRRRPVSELPVQHAGTVLVFAANGRYQVEGESRRRTGREPAVVSAISVSVVDVRPRDIQVRLVLPSQIPAAAFDVTVTFRCRVRSPERVVADGPKDLLRELLVYLEQDSKLKSLGLAYSVTDIREAQSQVEARVQAYVELRPPALPGVDVALLNIEVRPPAGITEVYLRGARHELSLLEPTSAEHELRSREPAVPAVGDLSYQALPEGLLAEIKQMQTPDQLRSAVDHSWDRGNDPTSDIGGTNRGGTERQRLEMYLQLLRALAGQGRLDEVNLNLEQLIIRIGETPSSWTDPEINHPARLGDSAVTDTGTDSKADDSPEQSK